MQKMYIKEFCLQNCGKEQTPKSADILVFVNKVDTPVFKLEQIFDQLHLGVCS